MGRFAVPALRVVLVVLFVGPLYLQAELEGVI
jgi:hypothetical protein